MKTDNTASYKKGEMITVDITDFGENGEGIGKTDAFTWFIKDTVIGDKVKAKVMKTKKSYGYARLESIVMENVRWQEAVADVHYKALIIKRSFNLSKTKWKII